MRLLWSCRSSFMRIVSSTDGTLGDGHVYVPPIPTLLPWSSCRSVDPFFTVVVNKDPASTPSWAKVLSEVTRGSLNTNKGTVVTRASWTTSSEQGVHGVIDARDCSCALRMAFRSSARDAGRVVWGVEEVGEVVAVREVAAGVGGAGGVVVVLVFAMGDPSSWL